MQIISQVNDFEKHTVAKRSARVLHDMTVRVYERNEANDVLREYAVPLATVTHPSIVRAARKERFQEFIDLPPLGTI